MEYSVLNRSYSHAFELEEGEGIDVSIISDSGKVSVTIGQEDGDPVYQGKEL